MAIEVEEIPETEFELPKEVAELIIKIRDFDREERGAWEEEGASRYWKEYPLAKDRSYYKAFGFDLEVRGNKAYIIFDEGFLT